MALEMGRVLGFNLYPLRRRCGVRETGVQKQGGIQGGYEYIEFTRTDVVALPATLLAVLRSFEPAAA
jgi:hypothetical protein